MRFINYVFLLFLSITFSTYSQVGINTTTPTAELEIQTTNTGLPALKINSQTSPNGSETGQIAVIGDKLYMYDATRGKWLSIETVALQYGRNGSRDDEILRYTGGVDDAGSGPRMPFDGTIVYMTINSSGGAPDKEFDIKINGTDVPNNADPTLDGMINLTSGSFTRTTYNIDFNAGDYILLEIGVLPSSMDVDDPAGVIWVKWRP